MQQSGSVRPITVMEVLQSGVKIKRRRGKAGPPAKNHIGLDPAKENRLRKQVLEQVPSAYWRDVQFTVIKDVGPDGEKISYRLFAPQNFPPQADWAAMGQCPHCLEQWDEPDSAPPLTPPDYREGAVVCVDHLANYVNSAFGVSPSARSIAESQTRNLNLEQHKLEPESKSALRREILRFIRRKKRVRRV